MLEGNVVKGLALSSRCFPDFPRPDEPDDMGEEYSCFQDTATGETGRISTSVGMNVEGWSILPYDIKDAAEDVKGILGHWRNAVS